MASPSSPIGDNLARVRKARGLTQEELAGASQVSVDVIARLEQGRKKGARWATLTRLANALGVQLAVLVTPPALLGGGGRAAGDDMMSLRQAVTGYAGILNVDDLAEGDNQRGSAQVQREVDRVWLAYHRGDFGAAAAALPELIGDARALVREGAAQRGAAHSMLATCYAMAAGITVMRGHQDLALTAVERAADAARGTDDPIAGAAVGIFCPGSSSSRVVTRRPRTPRRRSPSASNPPSRAARPPSSPRSGTS